MTIKLTMKKKSIPSFLKPIGYLFEEVTATYKKAYKKPGKGDSEESYEEFSEPESMRQQVMDSENALPPSEDGWLVARLGFGNVKKVGEGVMGKVFVGTWDSRDGVERAIKIVEEENALRELNAYRIISNVRKEDPLIAKHFPDVEFTGIDPDTGKGVIIMELLEDDPNAKQVIWDMFGGKEIWWEAGEDLKDDAAISTGDQKNQIIKRTEALISDRKSREHLLKWITGMMSYEPSFLSDIIAADFRNMTSINQKLAGVVKEEIDEYEVWHMGEGNQWGDIPDDYLDVIKKDYKGSAIVINFINMLIMAMLDEIKKIINSQGGLPWQEHRDAQVEFWATTTNILKEFINSARQWTPIGMSPDSRDYRYVGAPKELEGGGYPGVKSVLAAIKKLYELTGLVAKDMHDGNVMVRHDTKDIVIVDVGLFKREKGWTPQAKEGKKAKSLRLVLEKKKYKPKFYKKKEEIADALKDEGHDEESAFAIADATAEKAGYKLKKESLGSKLTEDEPAKDMIRSNDGGTFVQGLELCNLLGCLPRVPEILDSQILQHYAGDLVLLLINNKAAAMSMHHFLRWMRDRSSGRPTKGAYLFYWKADNDFRKPEGFDMEYAKGNYVVEIILDLPPYELDQWGMVRYLEEIKKESLDDDVDFKSYGSEEGRSEADIKTDRNFKREWNKKADQKFFDNEVLKIHYLAAFGGNDCTAFAGRNPDACISGIVKSFLKTNSTKNELSVVGFHKTKPNSGGRNLSAMGLIVDGYTSYASKTDARTEWTSFADKAANIKHKGSGLPKRAAKSVGYVDDDDAMYGREDFVEPKDADGRYNELIVDNWKVVGIVLDMEARYWQHLIKKPKWHADKLALVIAARKQEFKDLVEFASANGIKIYNFDMTPIEIIQERNKHHPKPGRHKKYFGSSVYDLPAMHGDGGGDAGDGGGGDGNRKKEKKKKKRILKISKIIRGKKK